MVQKRALRTEERTRVVGLLRDHLDEAVTFLRESVQVKSHAIQATLMIRADELYQAAVILLETNRVTGAAVVLRSLVETVFLIKVASDETSPVFRNWRNQHLLDERKFLEQRIRDAAGPIPEEVRARLRELKKQTTVGAVKRIAVTELAKAAGLQAEYETAFSYLSWSVHGAVQHQQKYFQVENGAPVGLRYEPDQENWPLFAGICCEWWGRAFKAVADTHSFAVPQTFRQRDREIAELIRRVS